MCIHATMFLVYPRTFITVVLLKIYKTDQTHITIFPNSDTNVLNSRSRKNSDKHGHHKPPQNIIGYCNFRKLRHLSLIRLIIARKRSLCFHRCLSVHGGGGGGGLHRGGGGSLHPVGLGRPPPHRILRDTVNERAVRHRTGMHSCCSIKTCEETGPVPYRSL